MACEELGLREEQEQRHEAQEALEKLAKQRAELKKQIELIQQQRKEERQLVSLCDNIPIKWSLAVKFKLTMLT